MPNWKKVIVSGSDANLNSLNLISTGSGQTVLDIQGSQGQLFSITDDLTGDIFSISDISGVPILNVNADGTTTFDGNITLAGPETLDSTSDTSIKFLTRDSNGVVKYHTLGSNAFNSNTYNNYSLPLGTTSARGGFKIGYSENGKNYPVELSSEKMYVNVPWTDNNTVYTHPTHPGDDINIDSGVLTDNFVISDIDFNITTDTLGHVTDANASIGKRALTLANLGYTGATNANNFTYTLPLSATGTRGGVKIGYSENGKNYPVELSSEKMFVNVPWTDNNTQRAIHDTPVNSATTTSISSNWAFDNVKKAVPSNAVFTDTNTQRSDEEIQKVISDAGFRTTDNNTQLTTAQVRSKISASGNSQYNATTGVIASTDTNTQRAIHDTPVNGATTTSISSNWAFDNVKKAVPSNALFTDTNTQRSDSYITEVIEKAGFRTTDSNTQLSTADVRGKISASGNSQYNASTGVITSTNTNTVTSVRRDNTGTYRTGNINLIGGTNVSISETSAGVFNISSTDTTTNTQLSTAQVRSKISGTGLISYNNSTGVISTTANNITNNNQIDNGAGYRTSAQVDAAIATVVDSAPAALNTLNELAASLGDDADFAGSVTTSLSGKLSTSGKAADSNLLDGLDLHTGRNHDANKVVRTNGSGYLDTGWINTTSGTASGTLARIYCSQDSYLRYLSPSAFLSSMGIAAGATNVTNNSQISNGRGYITSYTDTNTQLSDEDITKLGYIKTYTDTNTTYSVGDGGLTQKNFTTTLKTKLDALDSSTYLKSNADDTFSGGLVSTARDEGIFGTYDSYKTDHIWSMGKAYKNHASGTNFGSLYGLAYKHTNNSTGGTMAGGHMMVWCENGTGKSAMGTNIWTSGTVSASGGSSTNWNTAYGWGNHASAGYKTTDNNTQLSTADVRGKISASGNSQYNASTGVITSTDTNTQRGIHDTPVNGATTTSISSNWAFDNVKKAVPSNAVFTDTNTQLSESDVQEIGVKYGFKTTDNNTTYSVGDGGLTQNNFTNADHTKLNGIATSANNYSHPTGAGNKHIPTGGSSGQFLKYSSSGTAVWAADNNTNTTYSVGDGGLTQKNFTSTLKTKLDGIATSANNYSFPYTVSAGQSNSTVVQRNGSGYIFSSYFNGTGTFATSGASSGMVNFTGTNGSDTYGRSYNATAARALLNVADGATNVTNNSQISNGRGYITSYTDTNTQLTTAQVRSKVSAGTGISYNSSTGVITNTVTNTNTQRSDSDITEVITKAGFKTTDNNTTYSADGNYGMTLSGTTFRLEDDRRRNSTGTDVYSGNTHDFTWYDASVGIRWYTAGGEDMRLLDNGTLHVDGDVVAYSSTVSDERLKDNIKTIENPLDKIKALRGVEYDWNNGNRKGKHDLGLIAQEVESVIPDIVHEHTLPYVEGEEDTLYKTVDYEKMVAVLIEGMKEQQTQIDSLKSELTEIKGKL